MGIGHLLKTVVILATQKDFQLLADRGPEPLTGDDAVWKKPAVQSITVDLFYKERPGGEAAGFVSATEYTFEFVD